VAQRPLRGPDVGFGADGAVGAGAFLAPAMAGAGAPGTGAAAGSVGAERQEHLTTSCAHFTSHALRLTFHASRFTSHAPCCQQPELGYTDRQYGETKTASRPERARGDGQDGGRALAVEIVPHEWSSGKCRARPPSKRHRWRALSVRRHLAALQQAPAPDRHPSRPKGEEHLCRYFAIPRG